LGKRRAQLHLVYLEQRLFQDDFDNDPEDDSSDYTSASQDFGSNDRPQRRRTFRKSNQYGRDNRDNDRPRRPFFKSSPRKKGYRPNEDYESEE